MAEAERRDKTESNGTLTLTIDAGSLLHMEQAAPLIPIAAPAPERLIALLHQGRTLPLASRESGPEPPAPVEAEPELPALDQLPELSDKPEREAQEAVQEAAPAEEPEADEPPVRAISTGLSREELEQALLRLALEQEEDACRHGWSGLCLAVDRLVSDEGLSAPLLLQPVSLVPDGQGSWLLARSGQGSLRNQVILRLLPTPEGDWSLNREPLARQLTRALPSRPSWRREEGLWLVRVPLWALELPRWLTEPVPADSAAALLSSEPAPEPDWEDRTGEEGVLTPLPLDGVQMTALNHLMQGRSLALSGGRGTGKTRLAVSVMANAMGVGQRTLLVAPDAGDRASAAREMARMGLDPLLLELSGPGDRKRSVLHQYNVAAQVRPETSAEGYFSLSTQTNQTARRLDSFVSALHGQGRYGLSPFQLICRYLAEDGVEASLSFPQPMLNHLDRQGLENRLECAEQLAQTAQALGNVADHPLELVWGCEYTDEIRDRLPDAVSGLLEEIGRLEEAGFDWCNCSGLSAPHSQEDWSRLREGARLLREWQSYPPSWADSPRIPLLQDAVLELREHVDRAVQLENRIREKWQDSVFSLDAVTLEKQWRFLQEGWTLPSEPDRERRLRQLLAQSEGILSNLEAVGRQWAQCIHAPMPTTRDSWERNYEVAVELARWKEIPSEWGSCPSLQALLWDVGELIDHGKQAKECKEVLLRDWDEAIFNFNGQALMERWQRDENGWGIGWIRRQSVLRSELERYCNCKLTPNLLENSLRWLVDYQSELAQCDEIYHRWERELKPVYQREDTVWLWLETARTVAAESHDWLTELTGSEDFLRQYGSSPEAVAAAGQLQAQWETARDTLGHLDVIVGRTSQPDSRNWLTERRNDCRRLQNLLQIRKLLVERAKGEPTLGEIGEALSLFARRQQEKEAAQALYERWETELEGLYQGPDTDWEELLTQSIRAVNSDDVLAELTGDLELRARLAGDADAQATAEALCEAYEAVCTQANALSQLVSAHLTAGAEEWLAELRQNAETLQANQDTLERWMTWRSLCRRGDSLGLHAFVEYLARQETPDPQAGALFRRSLYRALLQLELDWNPDLKQFTGRGFADLLRQYSRLDETLARRTREELLHVAATRLPDLVREPLLQEEVSLLRWANGNEGRDISLEGLIHGLPRITRGFFPCVIASPSDALRCLGGGNFDYIIIDGAEALPAPVGRALLGLGKTALLLSGNRGRISFPTLTNQPSLWEVCAHLPRLALERCYLSRQERLLWLEAPGETLRLYPVSQPNRFRVRCQPVVGRLRGDVNAAEAAAVAARAVRMVGRGKTDLAVTALTGAQAQLIRTLLEQAAQETPELAERLSAIPVLPVWALGSRSWELLLCSVTLAPDEGEGLSAAGALLRDWDDLAPLTAILAAARSALLLFTSVDRQDWPRLERLQPQLARLLRMADEGQTPPLPPAVPAANRIQEELCQALQELGYPAEPAPAPLSIRVTGEEGCRLGILLDDEVYGAVPRTRERELTQVELLEAQGWRLHRVWAMDWLRNRQRVLDLLTQTLEQPPEEPDEEAQPSAAAPPPHYAPAKLTVMGIRENEVGNPTFQNRIYRVVEQIIQQEAPLAVPQLSYRMLTAFGLDAEDPELLAHCASLWRKLGLRMTHESGMDYVWRTDQDPDQYRQFRVCVPEEAFRKPEYVSCQESANAALAVLGREKALVPATLARETARLLGYDPEDEAALACGQRGVDCALMMGRILDTPIGTVIRNPAER